MHYILQSDYSEVRVIEAGADAVDFHHLLTEYYTLSRAEFL